MNDLVVKGLSLLLLFVAGVAAGAAGATWRADAALAKVQTAHATELVAASLDAHRRESVARAEERRVQFSMQERVDVANLRAAGQHAAAVRADHARRELLHAYTTVAAALGGTTEDAAATPGGAPAGGAGLVLADVFGRSSERLQECAAALDASRTAGQLCEQSYDLVVPP